MKKSKIDSKLYQLTLEKMVIGLEEPILIKGVGEIIAKVDSGNGGYNVIHGEDLTVQGNILTFKTFNKDGKERRVSKKIKETLNVNIGGGHIQERPVVELDVQFGGQDYKKILFSVTDRSDNDNKVLISKDFVGKELDALIDVNKTKIADDGIEVEYVSEGLRNNIITNTMAKAGKKAGELDKAAGNFLAWTQGTGDMEESKENKISKDTEDEIDAINKLDKMVKEDAELVRKQVAASQKLESLNVKKDGGKDVVPVVKIYDYTGGTPYEESIPAEYKEKLKKALKSAKKLIKKGGDKAKGLDQNSTNSENNKISSQKNESFLDIVGELITELADQTAADNENGQENNQPAAPQDNQQENDNKNNEQNPNDVEQSELGPEDMSAEELQKLFDELKAKNRGIIYIANFKVSNEEGTELQSLEELKQDYQSQIVDFCSKVSTTKLDMSAIGEPVSKLAKEISNVTDKKIKGVFALVSGKQGSRKCELLVNPQQLIDSVAKGTENEQNKQKSIAIYKEFDKKFQEALKGAGLEPMPLNDASWKKYNANLVYIIYDNIAKILEAGLNSEGSKISSVITDQSLLSNIQNYTASFEDINDIITQIESLKGSTTITYNA